MGFLSKETGGGDKGNPRGLNGVSSSHCAFEVENDPSFEWLPFRLLATRTSCAGSRSRLDAPFALPAAGGRLKGLQGLQNVLNPGDFGVDVLAPAHQDLQLALALL